MYPHCHFMFSTKMLNLKKGPNINPQIQQVSTFHHIHRFSCLYEIVLFPFQFLFFEIHKIKESKIVKMLFSSRVFHHIMEYLAELFCIHSDFLLRSLLTNDLSQNHQNFYIHMYINSIWDSNRKSKIDLLDVKWYKLNDFE